MERFMKRSQTVLQGGCSHKHLAGAFGSRRMSRYSVSAREGFAFTV